MHPDHLAQLVRDALVHSGCSREQIGSFDGHSTIEMELADLPNLNICYLSTGLWFWSPITELGVEARGQRADALLGFLMHGFGPARTEQLQLNDIDGVLELRVLLSDEASANAEQLAAAMEEYIARLTALRDLLRC
jgi:hypothetical protein